MSISKQGRFAFFDEERLLVAAPECHSVLCGGETIFNTSVVGSLLVVHVEVVVADEVRRAT